MNQRNVHTGNDTGPESSIFDGLSFSDKVRATLEVDEKLQKELKMIRDDSRKGGLFGDLLTPLGNLRIGLEAAEMFAEYDALLTLGLSTYLERKIIYINSALSRVGKAQFDKEFTILINKQLDAISPVDLIAGYNALVVEINKTLFIYQQKIEKGESLSETEISTLQQKNELLIKLVEGEQSIQGIQPVAGGE